MIDPTFRNINRLYFQPFKAGENDLTSNSFCNYYMPLVEIKVFNVLIDKNKISPIPNNKEDVYEKLERNNDCQEAMINNIKVIGLLMPPKLLQLHWS